MRNQGLFSTLFIEDVKSGIETTEAAAGRLATLCQTWKNSDLASRDALWGSFVKQAVSYLEFAVQDSPMSGGVYPLHEDFTFGNVATVLFLIEPGADIDDTAVGRFYPAKLIAQLKHHDRKWGILTDGRRWRLYATHSTRPFEDYVELDLEQVLETADATEYAIFEHFFPIVTQFSWISPYLGPSKPVERSNPASLTFWPEP
jgi:hypothetical protein